MKASPASSLPKGKGGFDLFYGLNIASKAQRAYLFIWGLDVAQGRGRTLSVRLWCLNIARRRGRLICSMASTSLEGVEGLSYLYWVSTPEERPALGVLSVFKHLGQKSRFGAHAHEEAYTTTLYHPWGV